MSSIRAKNISWLLCMPHTVVQVVSCTRLPPLRRYIHKDFLVKWQSSILSKGILSVIHIKMPYSLAVPCMSTIFTIMHPASSTVPSI